MKKLVLLLAVMLSACQTLVPVGRKMPDLPDKFAAPCKDLLLLETDKKILLSTLMKTVTKNYTSRHDCAAQVESMQEWYLEQKQIFDNAHKQ